MAGKRDKKIVLFDLDNTLFDSPSFKQKIFSAIETLSGTVGKKNEITRLCYQVYDELIERFGLFDADVFIEKLSESLRIVQNKEKILQLIFDSSTLKDNFHKDVLDTLSTLSKKHDIGIFSQGEKRFQNAKISAIAHTIHPARIHIAKDKKAEMEKIFAFYKNLKIIFVDDMEVMLYEAHKINPRIYTVWIKRGRYAQNQKPIAGFTPNLTIHTLHELIPAVENL